MFLYGIDTSYNEMQLEIKKTKYGSYCDYDKNNLNFRIGTFLHWLIDCYERIEKKASIDESDKKFFSGLRYINNKLKHDNNIVSISQKTGGMFFPLVFPVVIPETEVIFDKIIEKSPKYQKQHNNYITYVSNKKVMEIADNAVNIIKKYK